MSGEAAVILDELADDDLSLLQAGNRLDIAGLRVLSQGRQRNAVRRLLRKLGLPVPGERQLTLLLATMHEAREDAQPRIAWPGARVHRYRQAIWFFSEALDPSRQRAVQEIYRWNPQAPLNMGPVRGTLALEACRGAGIAADFGQTELIVRFRAGRRIAASCCWGRYARSEESATGKQHSPMDAVAYSFAVPWGAVAGRR